jgi:SNF2 family DNA or RNA helicase
MGCHLTEEQAELYRATLKNLEADLASATGIKRSAAVLRVLTKLKQTCNHPAHVLEDRSPLGERSGKLNRLVELLEDEVLKNGYKALVFTQYAEMGRMLDEFLLDRLNVGTQFLCGEDSAAERQKKVKTFQEDSRFPIFVLTHKAGGV